MKNYTAVGCHIYAGGFTIGMRKHFNVLAHLEQSKYGVASVNKNMPDIPVFIDEDGNWRPQDYGLPHYVDVVYGNPPCAAFSVMNNDRQNWKTDGRLDCARAHFLNISRFNPKVFIYESVCGAFTLGRPFVDELAKRAMDMGYSVTHFLHACSHMGLPQKRLRYFFIAHKVPLDLLFAKQPKKLKCIDFLKKVKDIGWVCPRWYHKTQPDLIKNTEQGGGLRGTWEKLHPPSRRRYTKKGWCIGRPLGCFHRLKADTLSCTVMGYFLIHPTKNRPLGLNEYRALCGYPQRYWFEGSEGGHASFMARAVSPPVADWLGARVRAGLDSGRVLTSPSVRIIDGRKWPEKLVLL